MRRLMLAGLCAALTGGAPLGAAETVEIVTAVIRVDRERPLPISRLDLPPPDLGFAGGALATEDNATTGRFTGQSYVTHYLEATPEDAAEKLEEAIAAGAGFIAVLAGAEDLLALSDAAGDRAVLLNAGAPDDRLRGADCRANVLHVAPSRAMLADALAQFLVWKRWTRWALIEGSHPEDAALAAAYRRAAEKFAARIVEERVFEDTGGARRTDTGHVQVQREIPVFTQRLPDHDVIVAADEADVFAAWLPFQSWEPRPVAGSAGLRPTSWHPAHESWAGIQYQTRFEKQTGRTARPEDYQVWVALRVVSEAATRTKSGDRAALLAYMLGEEFGLGAFKGEALSFRDWDGQLRQPILLAADKVLVSVSPQDEYLHQFSRLDTLGIDRPETECRLDRRG